MSLMLKMSQKWKMRAMKALQWHMQKNLLKIASGPWFTFDDVPLVKWRVKLNDMGLWIDVPMTKPRVALLSVTKEFVARMTGT